MKIFVILIFILNFCFASIGQITALVGDASITRASENIKVSLGLKIENKDIIKTQKNSKLQIIFTDNTIVTVGKNSALDISDYLFDEKKPENSKTNLNFFKGSFKTITGQIGKINRKRFKLKTKTASIGIRGTFILGNQDTVACIQGGISVESMGVLVNVDANEFTKLAKGKAPSAPKTLTQKSLQNLQQNIEPTKNRNKNQPTKVIRKNSSQKQAPAENNSLHSRNVSEVQGILKGGSNVSNLSNEKSKDENILNIVKKDEQTQNQNDDEDEQTQNQNDDEDEQTQNQNDDDIEDKIDDIGDIEQKLSFEGKVEGVVYTIINDEPTPNFGILDDGSNKVSLKFDIGGGENNMTGEMKFKAVDDANIPSNTFKYDLSSTNANLKNDVFPVTAVHKDFETEHHFNIKGNTESVGTINTVNLREDGDDGERYKANITFEATKK